MQDENKTQLMFVIVEQWQQSGKSQSRFSSENGIRLHTVWYFRELPVVSLLPACRYAQRV